MMKNLATNNTLNTNFKFKFTQIIKRYLPLLLIVLFLLVTADAILAVAAGMPDTDTHFIISTGKYIVENKEVPKINPFIIDENFKVIIQQWSFDVIVYLLYSSFSYAGIFVFACFFMLVAMFIGYKFISLYTDNFNIKLLMMTCFIRVYYTWAQTRPTLISFSLLLTTIIVLEYFRRDRKKWLIYFLPLISLITINIHASMWPMMFVVMLPYICPNIFTLFCDFKNAISVWWNTWKRVIFLIPVMILVGFINPNGLRGMGYVFLSYGTANSIAITELLSPMIATINGLRIILVLIVLMIYIFKNKRKVDSAPLYMTLGTLLLASMHLRNGWFLLFGSMPLLITLLNDVKFLDIKKSNKFKNATKAIVALASVIIVLIVACTYTFHITDNAYYSINAANYLDQFKNREDIIMYTEFNNGAYMEFRGYKVLIDARPELYAKKINGQKDLLSEWDKARRDVFYLETMIEQYGFSHMLVEDGSIVYGYMVNHSNYEPIIEGNGYVLYQKIGWVGDSMLVH